VLKKQAANIKSSKSAVGALKAMVRQARGLRAELTTDIDVLGPYLHEGWERKRTLAQGISNPLIDDAYERALAAGATGGKLLGAGASGFLLVYAPEGTREAICEALSDLKPYPVPIDPIGATTIYSD
jgi:D-glycero-alpha-D-manno-heptose-7-phosphate kinase